KMKIFTALLCTMVALASATAVPFDSYDDAVAKREVAAAFNSEPLFVRDDENVDIVAQDLEDGSSKVEIVVDGVSNGYVIIDADGEIHGFHSNGTEVSLDELDGAVLAARDSGDAGIEKRAIGLIRLLRRLAPIIKRFGSRVVSWVRCVGAWSLIFDCSSKVCPVSPFL
ncbi:hypothetical protein N658DRAFT_436664, partial [Parathielavia hyrcaniae]